MTSGFRACAVTLLASPLSWLALAVMVCLWCLRLDQLNHGPRARGRRCGLPS